MAKNENFMRSSDDSEAKPESRLEPISLDEHDPLLESPFNSPFESPLESPLDPRFDQQVQRLYHLTVYGRWLLVSLLWLTVAPLCLWNLRSEFELWHDYFTWTAVRYGLAYHRFATAGLAVCIGITVSTLVWQSRNLFWGPPAAERKRLERQVLRIRRKGKSHPLWKWVCSR